jgi:uncharacterized protein (DUF58 family)
MTSSRIRRTTAGIGALLLIVGGIVVLRGAELGLFGGLAYLLLLLVALLDVFFAWTDRRSVNDRIAERWRGS